MTFGAPVPILRILDEAKAREFYVDWLGFQIDFEHRFQPGMIFCKELGKDLPKK